MCLMMTLGIFEVIDIVIVFILLGVQVWLTKANIPPIEYSGYWTIIRLIHYFC